MAAYSEVGYDRIGSVICKKAGTSDRPRIMLAGHMDEIGFFVRDITKEGFIRFMPLGGWWNQVMLAQRVKIRTRQGDVVGIIGSRPPHVLSQEDRNKVVEKDAMFIDVGAKDQVEATEVFGIRPGDPIVPDSPFTVMQNPDYLLAKAWDDRLGCAIFMEVIKQLQGVEHPNTVYGVGTVQEEVGLRGATTSAQVVDPDIGFALEVGIAGDTPGVDQYKASEKLGGGPAILLYDSSMIGHPSLREFVVDVAKEVGIPVQFDTMAGGGTDAGRMHVNHAGAPSLVLGVPTRYIHSHSGIIHRRDYEQTIKLLLAIIQRLDEQVLANLLD
jgi:endoglucanase